MDSLISMLYAGDFMRHVITVVVFCFLYVNGCGTPDYSGTLSDPSKEDDRHWHDKYVEDNCKRCPDCCITVVPGGGDPPPALKRLPPKPEIEQYNPCSGCPGVDCICTQDANGTWWVDDHIGPPREYEDYGKYDDPNWPDCWTPPDDEE